MLSRFHLIPEHHGPTDRTAISISHISVLSADMLSIFHIYLWHHVTFDILAPQS